MSSWPDAVRLAVGTLTRWPVAAPSAVDRRRGGRAMLLAPLIGLILGLGGAAVAFLAARLGLDSLVTAALVITALALASHGLHLDGLADTVDGLGSGGAAERALEVMRRGDVGPLGAAGLVLVLLVQTAALSAALTGWGPAAVVASVTASRLALPLACLRGVPAARDQGLGAAVAGSVPRTAAALAVAAVALTGSGLALLAGRPTWAGLIMVGAVVAVTGFAVRVCIRRLGGITGDVLGATVELGLAAALVAVAAA